MFEGPGRGRPPVLVGLVGAGDVHVDGVLVRAGAAGGGTALTQQARAGGHLGDGPVALGAVGVPVVLHLGGDGTLLTQQCGGRFFSTSSIVEDSRHLALFAGHDVELACRVIRSHAAIAKLATHLELSVTQGLVRAFDGVEVEVTVLKADPLV